MGLLQFSYTSVPFIKCTFCKKDNNQEWRSVTKKDNHEGKNKWVYMEKIRYPKK